MLVKPGKAQRHAEVRGKRGERLAYLGGVMAQVGRIKIFSPVPSYGQSILLPSETSEIYYSERRL
jgi:hypothetical protein